MTRRATTTAIAVGRSVGTSLMRRPRVTVQDQPGQVGPRLAVWPAMLLLAGCGAGLLAGLVEWRSPRPSLWLLFLVVAAGLCLAALTTQVLSTIGVARTALERLEDPSTDPLTGLVNRRGLGDTLDRWLGEGRPVTLLALDLADFRLINEEAGHQVGDRVLTRVATGLTVLGGVDTVVARIDGDDFALAFAGVDPARASVLAADVRESISRRFVLDGHHLHLTVNVSTTVAHPLPGGQPVTTDLLLRCADQALAEAQASTGGTAVHDPARCGVVQAHKLLGWVDDLHAALAVDDQLILYVQPQRRVGPDGSAAEIVGCEALLRWVHPTRGLLGPSEALQAAEHGHLAGELSGRVLDLALAAVSGWWARCPVPIAVNLTAIDLDDALLPHRIQDALNRHGVPAAALTVEVVEDTLMLDPDRALETLGALRSIGLRVAVDDYGTGYSSLAYLHRLPIDEVKIDRSLTAGLATDTAAAIIVGRSIELVHDLGLLALAEGVETAADLEMLAAMGCDAVQGWLTGRPMPLAAWSDLLVARARDGGTPSSRLGADGGPPVTGSRRGMRGDLFRYLCPWCGCKSEACGGTSE